MGGVQAGREALGGEVESGASGQETEHGEGTGNAVTESRDAPALANEKHRRAVAGEGQVR